MGADNDDAQGHCHEIQSLQEDIAAWADRCYGSNISQVSGVELESLAPLIGIVSKLAELQIANTQEERISAIEDTFLYLCDFASREDIEITHIGRLPKVITANEGLDAVGKLTRTMLYYHRDLISYDEYKMTIIRAIDQLIAYLEYYTESNVWGTDVILIFRSAWKKVKRRDRKKRTV